MICNEIVSSSGHKLFGAIMAAVGIVAIGMVGALVLGPIGGAAIIALTGQSSLTGAPALVAMFFTCVPGPVIGAILGYMVAKGSNDTRR